MTSFDVFLSHAGDDKPAVEKLARKLRDDGLRVFFDRWELVPGAPWQEALEKALADSRTCAVFLGPQGLSPWHTAEMRVALGQRVAEEPKRVIPVLLPGASPDDIPSFLAQRTWVDFRGGLDDEAAFSRLVAGIRGTAPDGGDPPAGESTGAGGPTRWRRAGVLGLIVGIVLVVLTTLAWVWPRQPTVKSTKPPPVETTYPEIYALRVQVLDPAGNPVQGSTVRTSAGNEPHRLPDDFWQFEIASAKVPLDRKVTIWAEHPEWDPGQVEIELTEDANLRVEVPLKKPETRLGGIVRDATNRAVAGARVTVMDRAAEPAVTDEDGRFELALEVAQGQRLRLHVEHPGYPPKDQFCYAGNDACAVTLTPP